MGSSKFVPAMTVGSLLVLVACASPADESGTASGASSITDLHGTFRFFTDASGTSREVSSIVYSDAFQIRLEGLPASAAVAISLTSYSFEAQGRGFVGTGVFTADAHGTVDTSIAPSTGGTYQGVDADGLVWSAKEQDVAEGLGPDRAAAYLEAKIGATSIAKRALARKLVADGVTTQKVTDDGLVATLFLPPPGAAPRVPVLAFGGSEGGISTGESFAATVASFGTPALALAYFGADGVPQTLTEVPLEYFAKAFAFLDRRPEVQKGKAVVMGASRGGELALQLGATFANVVGVIAEMPSSYRWGGGSSSDGPSAWTFQGQPLAFVPSSSSGDLPTVEGPGGAVAFVFRGQFEHDVASASPAALEAARIHVEDTHGPILMLTGNDDQIWPSCDFAASALTHLSDSGHAARFGDEAICYPDTGHAIGFAGVPASGTLWSSLGDGTFLSLGGTVPGNGRSGRASYEKIRSFLDRVTK